MGRIVVGFDKNGAPLTAEEKGMTDSMTDIVFFCGECHRGFQSVVLKCNWCGSSDTHNPISLMKIPGSIKIPGLGDADEELNADGEADQYEYFCSECEAEVAESSDSCPSCGAYIGDDDLVPDGEVEQAGGGWEKGWIWFREQQPTHRLWLIIAVVVMFSMYLGTRGDDEDQRVSGQRGDVQVLVANGTGVRVDKPFHWLGDPDAHVVKIVIGMLRGRGYEGISTGGAVATRRSMVYYRPGYSADARNVVGDIRSRQRLWDMPLIPDLITPLPSDDMKFRDQVLPDTVAIILREADVVVVVGSDVAER